MPSPIGRPSKNATHIQSCEGTYGVDGRGVRARAALDYETWDEGGWAPKRYIGTWVSCIRRAQNRCAYFCSERAFCVHGALGRVYELSLGASTATVVAESTFLRRQR